MSYGFTLVPTDSEQYLAAFARDDSEHDEELPASPAQRERMHAVGAALKEAFPSLPQTWFDEDLIELTSPPPGSIQISLYPREGAVALPLHPQRDDARRMFAEAWTYLDCIRKTGRYRVFDPQTQKEITVADDLELSRAVYLDGAAKFDAVLRSKFPPAKAFVLFPEKLNRRPYLLRWCSLALLTGCLFFATLQFVLRTPYETAVLIPLALGLIVKVLLLDPARLRDIGWSPALTFVSLFPPAGLFLQVLLFTLSTRRV